MTDNNGKRDYTKPFLCLSEMLAKHYRREPSDVLDETLYSGRDQMNSLEHALEDSFNALVPEKQPEARAHVKKMLFRRGERNYSEAFLRIALNYDCEVPLDRELDVPVIEEARQILRDTGICKDSFDPSHSSLLKYYARLCNKKDAADTYANADVIGFQESLYERNIQLFVKVLMTIMEHIPMRDIQECRMIMPGFKLLEMRLANRG